jgi:geranylgeranyl diphosphate synthase type II
MSTSQLSNSISLEIEGISKERARLLERFLDAHFAPQVTLLTGHRRLLDSIRYSLLQEGAKRFRPLLAMLVAEALGNRPERVLPFAAAVECVHTYSLVHDDLPAMDNDDFRRGQPTNHRKFDEATAILAGDGLLTEAFLILAENFVAEPDLAVRSMAELAKASGFNGMVGGQAIDMASKKESIAIDELRTMHRLKTGALIRASGVGAAILCRASEQQIEQIADFSQSLGLAFQVADDILDFDSARPEPGSYPALLGLHKTKEFLSDLTDSCLASLGDWSSAADPLRQLAQFNRIRST